jgi:hypothetical protein
MKFSDRVADHRRPLLPRGCAVEAVHRRVSTGRATVFYMVATTPWKHPLPLAFVLLFSSPLSGTRMATAASH